MQYPKEGSTSTIFTTTPHTGILEKLMKPRVRYTDNHAVVTYKGAKLKQYGLKAREELNFAVESGEIFEQMLDRLGFLKTAEVNKWRENFQLGKAAISLDMIDELGTFVEIEIMTEADNATATDQIQKIAKEIGVNGEPILASYLNFYSLNSQKFNLDIPCLGPEVEHCTVAVHRGTGVYYFYTVNIHHAALLVNVSAADQIKLFHVAADALAAYMLAFDQVECLEWRCVREKDVMHRLFHLCHRTVKQDINLLIGHLKRGSKRCRIRSTNANDGHFPKVDLVAMQANGVRMFNRIDDLTRVTVSGHCKAGDVDA